jgi:hypothetical protein
MILRRMLTMRAMAKMEARRQMAAMIIITMRIRVVDMEA